MRILIDIGHPAHVHFYKHAAWKLIEKGHQVFFTARDKDVTVSLLKEYGFSYKILTEIGKGSLGLYKEFILREWALRKVIKEFKPDVMTELMGDFIAPLGFLLGIPTIVYTDSEPVAVDKILSYPFASALFTPTCFTNDIGKRQIRYAGYHELAYLAPKYFTPDPSVLKKINVKENEPFSVLRFVAWRASHDIGQKGFSTEVKRQVISTLEKYGRVFISSEKPLTDEFDHLRITLPPHQVHDLMYYAQLLMGDGATMATEACILGTPAVRSSSMALNMGNFVELMDRYQLVYSYYDPMEGLMKAESILSNKGSKDEWKQKRDIMLKDKIDVTALVIDSLENYPKYLHGAFHGKIISPLQ
jgi:uncharacterized protein